MRRKDREITGDEELDAILRAGDCLHLGLSDGDRPYVVPVNYGFEHTEGRRTLYFHGADEGKKRTLLEKNGQAAFCVDTEHALVAGPTAASYSYRYACVMGSGTVTVLEDPEEKRRGLSCIVAHYAPQQPMDAPEETVAATAVYRLEVEEISGKRRS